MLGKEANWSTVVGLLCVGLTTFICISQDTLALWGPLMLFQIDRYLNKREASNVVTCLGVFGTWWFLLGLQTKWLNLPTLCTLVQCLPFFLLATVGNWHIRPFCPWPRTSIVAFLGGRSRGQWSGLTRWQNSWHKGQTPKAPNATEGEQIESQQPKSHNWAPPKLPWQSRKKNELRWILYTRPQSIALPLSCAWKHKNALQNCG